MFFFFFFKQKTAYEMQRGLVGSEMCIRDSINAEYMGYLEMWESFNQYAKKRELIRIVSDKTSVPAGIVFLIILIIATTLLLKGIGSLIMVMFLSFIFPAYLTFKALKMETTDTLIRLGKYWVVLAFAVVTYNLVEWFASDLPFLGIIKMICSYLLVKQSGAGGVYLFDNLFAPLIGRYENYIDSKLEDLHAAAQSNSEDFVEMKDKVAGAAVGAAMGAATKIGFKTD
eukprot:TRINITY_DN1534_c0_g1_i2.p1 TRINITY_DN1534_c0_g1~~TRINITY_DN1534_c0_g1_i2.p1  ORF type:complete len:228 (-),score=61.29 TRINITY_DN1534_c0_g1_i2:26-709(-)